ncbi:MAG: helix-turn-helix transcriptional regulator [Oscillospiraceae bacterium]|nr:helix-turn-helix transcriptional regulator [Oscillospiraceae bacterium]
MAVGFDEKSADVRIAQYESGTRTPKQALVEQLAEALDVNPRFLADDEILGAEGVMMMLFELDEHYPISIEDCEDEDGNKRCGIVFGSILMTDLLSEWQRRKKTLLTVRSARPNIQNGSWAGRKRPMTAESMSLRKSGIVALKSCGDMPSSSDSILSRTRATCKPLDTQNNSASLPVTNKLSLRF